MFPVLRKQIFCENIMENGSGYARCLSLGTCINKLVGVGGRKVNTIKTLALLYDYVGIFVFLKMI